MWLPAKLHAAQPAARLGRETAGVQRPAARPAIVAALNPEASAICRKIFRCNSLQVYKHRHKGWCLRTLTFIEKGARSVRSLRDHRALADDSPSPTDDCYRSQARS